MILAHRRVQAHAEAPSRDQVLVVAKAEAIKPKPEATEPKAEVRTVELRDDARLTRRR